MDLLKGFYHYKLTNVWILPCLQIKMFLYDLVKFVRAKPLFQIHTLYDIVIRYLEHVRNYKMVHIILKVNKQTSCSILYDMTKCCQVVIFLELEVLRKRKY